MLNNILGSVCWKIHREIIIYTYIWTIMIKWLLKTFANSSLFFNVPAISKHNVTIIFVTLICKKQFYYFSKVLISGNTYFGDISEVFAYTLSFQSVAFVPLSFTNSFYGKSFSLFRLLPIVEKFIYISFS